jgi:LuxR family transcriptional activator of bioluminescence operon
MEKGLIERLMALDDITEPDELTTHIERIVQGLGFDYFRLAIIIPVSHQRPEIRILNSCPEEWIESYSKQGMIARDPVVAAARRQLTPIRWDKVRGTDEQMDVMIEAAKCGLRCGVSYPLHGPRGEHGVLSFITERYQPALYVEIASTLAMVVPNVLEAAIRICRPKGDAGLKVIEADCLFWVSEGKSSAEISIILGIPERTVTHHLNSATRKLGASNRYNAVAKAMAGGELAMTLDRVTVIDH